MPSGSERVVRVSTVKDRYADNLGAAQDMVERLINHQQLYAVDPVRAERYWDFVRRAYGEYGISQTSFDELAAETEEFYNV